MDLRRLGNRNKGHAGDTPRTAALFASCRAERAVRSNKNGIIPRALRICAIPSMHALFLPKSGPSWRRGNPASYPCQTDALFHTACYGQILC